MIAIICLVLQIALTAIAFKSGWHIGKKPRRVWLPAAFTSLIFLVSLRWLFYRADLAFSLLPATSIFFEMTAFVPFAVFFFALASHHVSTTFTRRSLLVLNGFLCVYLLVYLSWICLPTIQCNDTKMFDDVCIQTTNSSCGPASIVTLLHHWKIPAEEQQMAYATYTTRGWGTTLLRITYLLQKFAQEHQMQVRLQKLEYAELAQLDVPCLVSIRYSAFMNHVVIVFTVEGNEVVIGDPLEGKVRWSKQKFNEQWVAGYAVSMHKE